MKVLVLNAGSSSLKYQIFDEEHSIEKGSSFPTSDLTGIALVGHRVVHGGERFRESVLMTDEVVQELEKLTELAPLHNQANLDAYYKARQRLPEAQHVAVFDTAFHSTLPECAYLFGLPYRFYETDKVRRYGFHGISHRYIAGRYAELSGHATHKIVSCHLGNGCSVAAIDAGRCVDTSMGYTPLDGLLMGTRSGDIDAGAVLHLMRTYQLDADAMEHLLNHESGLLGVSGLSRDMREVLASTDPRAKAAVDLFCYRVRKYIGAYAAAMDGLDAIVFTGGIGENSPEIRQRICERLTFLGVRLDTQTGLPVWVIPTNEELVIAQDALRCFRAAHAASPSSA